MNRTVRWLIVTLATVLACVTTASLGVWQLSRAHQKEALHARIQAQASLPVVGDAAVSAGLLRQADAAYRSVRLHGTWLPAHTVYLDNRPWQGRAGWLVLTPMRLHPGGELVMVQRGWAPRHFQDRMRLPGIETAAGRVQIEGRIAPWPSALYQLGSPDRGAIRQNIEHAAWQRETGLQIAPMTVQQLGVDGEGLLRRWPSLQGGWDKHYGYAAQWFAMSLLLAGLYVWFQWARPFFQRQRAFTGAQ